MNRGYRASTSLFKELLAVLKEQKLLNPLGIPVSTIDGLFPRHREAPFAEGQAFSGSVVNGAAEVCVTLAASPHFTACVPFDLFRESAHQAFGRKPGLPRSFDVSEKIAPHLIVWWRYTNSGHFGHCDLTVLASMSPYRRVAVSDAVAIQVRRALGALECTDGQALIYGSWGYSDPGSRARLGFSRGAPTLPDGHLHVVKVRIEDQMVVLKEVDPTVAVKHYQPWNRVINCLLGPHISHMLESVCSRNGWESIASVKFYDRVVKHGASHLSQQQGYEICYERPQPFRIAFSHIIGICGEVEACYQELSILFEEYHLSAGNPLSQARIVERLLDAGRALGFTSKGSELLAEFVTRIVPTSSQLREWSARPMVDASNAEELASRVLLERESSDRALRIARRRKGKNTVVNSLVADTYSDPRLGEIVHTWPEKSSVIYLFDDIEVSGEQVLVHKSSLHPAFISAAGAPEIILGASVIRDVGAFA